VGTPYGVLADDQLQFGHGDEAVEDGQKNRAIPLDPLQERGYDVSVLVFFKNTVTT
jgi:hypothetical protein